MLRQINIHSIKSIFLWPFRLLCSCYYKYRLGYFGKSSRILNPLIIAGGKNIHIGNHVLIQDQAWLAAEALSGEEKCQLVIDDECTIGHYCHIYSTKEIVIQKNVLIADKVYISDNLHGYENLDIPIKKQPIVQNGTVMIGEGSWLGENVCVLGSRIGKHCVIGANSVVTHDISDYSVAVGVPAKVIKRYDFINKTWRKV